MAKKYKIIINKNKVYVKYVQDYIVVILVKNVNLLIDNTMILKHSSGRKN